MQRRPYFSVDVVLLNVSKMYLGIILLSSLMIVSSYGCLLREVVKKKRPFYVKKAPMGTRVPKWRLTWLGCEIHSQELWVPWGCKNLGESNFHMENGLREAQKLPNRYYHISRSQGNLSEFFFVNYWGCGRHFSGGDRSDLLKRGELLHLWFCLSLCKMSNLAP